MCSGCSEYSLRSRLSSAPQLFPSDISHEKFVRPSSLKSQPYEGSKPQTCLQNVEVHFFPPLMTYFLFFSSFSHARFSFTCAAAFKPNFYYGRRQMEAQNQLTPPAPGTSLTSLGHQCSAITSCNAEWLFSCTNIPHQTAEKPFEKSSRRRVMILPLTNAADLAAGRWRGWDGGGWGWRIKASRSVSLARLRL